MLLFSQIHLLPENLIPQVTTSPPLSRYAYVHSTHDAFTYLGSGSEGEMLEIMLEK